MDKRAEKILQEWYNQFRREYDYTQEHYVTPEQLLNWLSFKHRKDEKLVLMGGMTFAGPTIGDAIKDPRILKDYE